MNKKLHLHDVVALLEDLPAKHFETDQPLLLRRGQIGTIVMTYDENAFEVEFADLMGELMPCSRPSQSVDAVTGCARIRDGLIIIQSA